MAALVGRLIADGATDGLLAPVLIIMALSAVLTGILLCVMGIARAGRVIRFIPYPVVGGFLGATGWLMTSGALRVITDHEVGFSTIDALLSSMTLAKLTAAGAIALALFLSLRGQGKNPYVLAGILLAGLAAAYLALALTGTTFGVAQAEGWMFTAPAALGSALPWDLDVLRNFPGGPCLPSPATYLPSCS